MRVIGKSVEFVARGRTLADVVRVDRPPSEETETALARCLSYADECKDRRRLDRLKSRPMLEWTEEDFFESICFDESEFAASARA